MAFSGVFMGRQRVLKRFGIEDLFRLILAFSRRIAVRYEKSVDLTGFEYETHVRGTVEMTARISIVFDENSWENSRKKILDSKMSFVNDLMRKRIINCV